MARKYDFISELYNRTCKTVVANPASWEAFLRSGDGSIVERTALPSLRMPTNAASGLSTTSIFPTRIPAAFPAEFPFGKCGTNTRQK